jgi:hypothetical protein
MATVAKGKITSLGRNSTSGTVYDIYLDNGAPTSAGTDLNILSAKLAYKSEKEDIDAHLLTSKATVQFSVANSTQASIFRTMVQANELQYRLRIEKDGELWWVGFMLVDLVTESFSGYPKQFTIVATDGISRLKNLDYAQNGLNEFTTVSGHLFNVLSYVPLGDYFATGAEYLRAHSTMIPQGMTGGVNVFEKLRLSFKALRTVDKKGEVTFQTVYDSLIEILKAFNLRLIFSNGRYVVSEIGDYSRQSEDVTFYRYDKAGTELSAETLASWAGQVEQVGADLSTSDSVARVGGEIAFLAPLKGVDLTYKHYSRQNLLPGYIWTQSFTPSARVENFRSNGGAGRLLLTSLLEFLITPDGTPPVVSGAIYLVIGVSIYIRDDNDATIKSLKRDAIITPSGVSYTEPVWTAGNNSYEVAIPAPPPQAERQMSQPFSITTPVIPDEGDLVLDFSVIRYVDSQNASITDVSINYNLSNVFLESLLSGSITDQYNYTYFNPLTAAAGDNSVELERELLFGDGPDGNTFGRIEFTENGTTWEPTDGWRRWEDGGYLNATTMAHGGLLAQMTLALQDSERERLDITVIAPDYEADYMFGSGTRLYLMQSGTISLNSDEWRGSWVEIAANFIDTAPTATDTNVPPIGDTGEGTGSTPDLPGTNPGVVTGPSGTGATPGLSAPGINTILSATDGGIVPDVEIGGLTVPNLADTPLFAGDIITMINPDTGETQNVEVSHDSGFIPGLQSDAGAVQYFGADGVEWLVPSTTEVGIVPITPTTSFPEGSYLQPDPQFTAQLQELLRKDYYDYHLFGFDDSLTTGFVGAFWRPNRRIGWHIRKVHFAFAQDMTGSTKINLKYYDATGYRYTVATYDGGGLGGVIDAFADVLEGYYRVQIETVTGTAPKGLTVTSELIKINT